MKQDGPGPALPSCPAHLPWPGRLAGRLEALGSDAAYWDVPGPLASAPCRPSAAAHRVCWLRHPGASGHLVTLLRPTGGLDRKHPWPQRVGTGMPSGGYFSRGLRSDLANRTEKQAESSRPRTGMCPRGRDHSHPVLSLSGSVLTRHQEGALVMSTMRTRVCPKSDSQ